MNCASYGNGADGFTLGLTCANCINCVSEDNTGYGFSVISGESAPYLYNCATYNNSSGSTSGTTALNSVIAYTASAFVSPSTSATGNFALNSTTGGGASLRSAGFPGALAGGTSTGYQDIGALRHADPASGGGSTLFPIGMTGGING